MHFCFELKDEVGCLGGNFGTITGQDQGVAHEGLVGDNARRILAFLIDGTQCNTEIAAEEPQRHLGAVSAIGIRDDCGQHEGCGVAPTLAEICGKIVKAVHCFKRVERWLQRRDACGIDPIQIHEGIVEVTDLLRRRSRFRVISLGRRIRYDRGHLLGDMVHHEAEHIHIWRGGGNDGLVEPGARRVAVKIFLR